MADNTDRNEGMEEVRAAVKQLQAEMQWVKLMLTGQRPSDAPQKTSPPWVTTVALVVVPILTAFIATKPWA